jgi:hypothetical protein
MEYAYRVAKWEDHQHYKDRNPPWIKLHYELLSSNTWVMLDDASRVLAVAIMLLASRHEGHVPASLDYIKRVAYLNKKPDLNPLISIGFITPLADASNLQAQARPETETETETEKRQRHNIIRPESISEDVWEDFKTHRKAKKAPVTNTVLKDIAKEAGKAGIELQQAYEYLLSRGWQTFKSDWYMKGTQNVNSKRTNELTGHAALGEIRRRASDQIEQDRLQGKVARTALDDYDFGESVSESLGARYER